MGLNVGTRAPVNGMEREPGPLCMDRKHENCTPNKGLHEREALQVTGDAVSCQGTSGKGTWKQGP